MITADALPGEPGAYALTFRLDDPVTLPISSLKNPVLAAGTYVYAGSAFGPGGIRARVSRHLRIEKKAHWHIDHLSARAACIEVKTYPGGRGRAGSGVWQFRLPRLSGAPCPPCRRISKQQYCPVTEIETEIATKQGKSDGSR